MKNSVSKNNRNFQIKTEKTLIDLGISYGSHLTFKDADMLPPTPLEDEIEQLRMIEPY